MFKVKNTHVECEKKIADLKRKLDVYQREEARNRWNGRVYTDVYKYYYRHAHCDYLLESPEDPCPKCGKPMQPGDWEQISAARQYEFVGGVVKRKEYLDTYIEYAG